MNTTSNMKLLLPAVLSPATAAIVGLGIGLLWLLRDTEMEEERFKSAAVLPTKTIGADKAAASHPFPAGESGGSVDSQTEDQAIPSANSDLDHQETIRKAMSELGKRSAVARAKKKAEKEMAKHL